MKPCEVRLLKQCFSTLFQSKYAFFSFTKNRMAIDFGFPKDVIITQRKDDIQEHIEKLNKEIALVMISEQ
jgi:hypothetical protein